MSRALCFPRRPLLWVALGLLCLLLLLLASCGAPMTGSAPEPQARMMAASSGPEMEMPWVGSSEYACLTTAFSDHLQRGPVGQEQAIGLQALRFRVGDLRSLIMDIPSCDNGGLRVVALHMGLNNDYAFDVALELICLTPDTDPDVYEVGTASTYYRIVNSNLLDMQQPISHWQSGPGRLYREKVVIQRSTGSAFQPFLPEHDVTSVLYLWEGQLERLIADNSMSDNAYLEVVPVAVVRHRKVSGATVFEGDFAQSVVLKGVDVALDDTVYEAPFQHKALEHGYPCPHMCRKVLLTAPLLPRKPGC